MNMGQRRSEQSRYTRIQCQPGLHSRLKRNISNYSAFLAILPTTISLSFSMKTKVKTVFGANLSQAGVHPFIRNPGPSFCTVPMTDCNTEICRAPGVFKALWRRLFSTSAGAHTVVATVPAPKLAKVCVPTSSFKPNCLIPSSSRFASMYVAICETFMSMLRTTLGPNPLKYVRKPSMPMRMSPLRALRYPYRSEGPFAPSEHMRTSKISAGLPIKPAMPPARPHML
jgi:hypothetical protein